MEDIDDRWGWWEAMKWDEGKGSGLSSDLHSCGYASALTVGRKLVTGEGAPFCGEFPDVDDGPFPSRSIFPRGSLNGNRGHV